MADDILKREFERFDRDGNGKIDEEEFSGLLVALGVRFSEEKAHVAFQAIDVNGNGHIEQGEFSSWWKRSIVKT